MFSSSHIKSMKINYESAFWSAIIRSTEIRMERELLLYDFCLFCNKLIE